MLIPIKIDMLQNDFDSVQDALIVTYSPRKEDLEWTQSTIEGRIFWAIPSVGCVFLFDHSSKEYQLFMKAEHSEAEFENLERVEANLAALEFSERESHLVGGAHSVQDVVGMLTILTTTMEERGELTPFWHSVKSELSASVI